MIFALLTGATVINEDLGDDIDLIGPEHLGEIKKSVTEQNETVLHLIETTEEVKSMIKRNWKMTVECTDPVLTVKSRKKIS